MKKTIFFVAGILLLSACVNRGKTNENTNPVDDKSCDCLENWCWVKETFENNDAGAQWIIEEKGLEAYLQFCDSIENELKKADDIYACADIINSWGKFFRKGHFSVRVNNPDVSTTDSDIPVHVDAVSYTIETVRQQAEVSQDPFIGAWAAFPYKIGIVLDTIHPNRKYVGFILDAEVEGWKKGDVKLEIFEKNNEFTANFYMQNRSVQKRKVWFQNEVELNIGNMKYINVLKADSLEQQLLEVSRPLFFKLSDKTALLRVPSFNIDQKEAIDALIESNKETILSHENLIVDLRGNTGGYDTSWDGIIPFIYTNPIKTTGMGFYSTPLNREVYFKNYSFLQRVADHKFIRNAKKNDGKYVARDSAFVTELETIHPNPKQVIVLVDEACASSTEQFILAARQSTKTSIYGKQTYGALDASNMVFVSSPDGCLTLGYCVTLTLRPPKDHIDNKGITPDVIIPDSVPVYQWVSFAEKAFD